MTIDLGVHDMINSEYHSHKEALSSTGARQLLKCPAIFRHEQLHGSTSTTAMEFGSVAHRLVLGKGEEIAILEHKDFRTLQAKADRNKARTEGKIPILASDMQDALNMASVVKAHPVAGKIFTEGEAEKAIFWQTGTVLRRAMVDWVSSTGLVDYKTTRQLDDRSIEKTIFEYGYHQQAAWYLDGAKAVGLPHDSFKFVFQMKDAPYLVRVVELDEWSINIGRECNQVAMDLYRDCEALDEWPGYEEEVTLGLPRWARGSEEA